MANIISVNGKIPTVDGKAIKAVGGGEKTDYTFSISNQQIEKFVDEVTYTSDYSTSSVSGYTSHSDSGRPNGQTIPNGGTLRLYNVGKLNEQTNGGKIYNIQPNTIGSYEIVNGDNVNACGKLTVSGGVRVIYGASFTNLRDLGGWTCDGGTVRYGLLYRSPELDDVSADDIAMLKNLLGINHEVDMRESGAEGGGTATFEHYLHQPMGNYADALSTAAYKLKTKTVLEYVMNCAMQGNPCLYHCAAGADRTGTVSWLLLGVLGVSQSDCDKEYEITNFGGPIRLRSTYLGALYNAVNAFDGDDFTNKCKNALLSCGISIALINHFRHAMIDGNPVDLAEDSPFVPQEETVANLKACTRMNWSSSTTSTKAPTNDNTYIALATTNGTLWQFTDRESNTCYVISVPIWATKVIVTTTDTEITGYKFRSYRSDGTAVGNADDNNTSGVYAQIAGADCIQITAKHGSTSSPWNYDSSQITVKFTNY